AHPKGVNGGHPGVVNAWAPDGPDDIPFTDDDGLKVLPNSLGASVGGGALGVKSVRNSQPLAHFRITSPIGWFEAYGTNYNPTWWLSNATTRTTVVRPYTTPATIGSVPTNAIFDASLRISAAG